MALPSFENVAAGFAGTVAGGVPVGRALATTVGSAATNVSDAVKTAWADATTPEAASAREASGAAAAGQLLTGGFNPDSASDKQALVGAIAGGLCLVPGGVVLGAALEGLYQAANVLGPALEKLWPKGTFHTGPDMTAARVFEMWSVRPQGATVASLPPMPAGSFAAFALRALASVEADSWNAKPTMGPHAVLLGLAAIWNRNATGPAEDVYVPALFPMFEPSTIGPRDVNTFRGVPEGYSPLDMPRCPPFRSVAQMSKAFLPASQVPSAIAGVVSGSSVLHITGTRYTAHAPAPASPKVVHLVAHAAAPKVVHLVAHARPPSAPTPPAPAAAPKSKAKVAIAGVVLGALAVGAKLYLVH